MDTTVVYHRDLDGFCSAAIAKMAGIEGQYMSVDYGDKESKCIPVGDRVYMLDFCLQPFERMEALNRAYELHWIDHHKSALTDAARRGFEASGSQFTATGLAACELAWMHFCPRMPMPEWVRLVGRYDVWDHAGGLTIPFHYGLSSLELDPATSEGRTWWGRIRHDPLVAETILADGKVIQAYVECQYAEQAKTVSFTLLFEGLTFIAFNHAAKGSLIADSVFDPDVHDAILSFVWARDHWRIGLYTDKPDVDMSVIAAKYNGGGHRGAAGFQCEELPFVFTRT